MKDKKQVEKKMEKQLIRSIKDADEKEAGEELNDGEHKNTGGEEAKRQYA